MLHCLFTTQLIANKVIAYFPFPYLLSYHRYTDDNGAKEPAKPAEVKTEEPVPAEVSTEETNNATEQSETKDETMYNGNQDGDDEIDFNLGNANTYNSPPVQESYGIGIKEDG